MISITQCRSKLCSTVIGWLLSTMIVSAVVLEAGDEAIPESADFVIVGGGTAGCVLASRLCQDLPQSKIVLLERGPPRTKIEEIYVSSPRLVEAMFFDAGPEAANVLNYFPSEPNSRLVNESTGKTGRTVNLVDGASLGGASNVAFQWSYPLDGTVDTWGIDGLDTEKAKDLALRAASVIKPRQPPPELRQDYFQEALDAFARANYTVKDKQTPGEGGYTAELNFLTFDDDGRRLSAFTNYLLPVLGLPCKDSLVVVLDATVTKVKPGLLSDGSPANRINTVEYVSSSMPLRFSNERVTQSITATHELILSAGPYGSPKILLQSGIGPEEDLRRKGVRPILNLPVGQKTQLRPLAGAVGRYEGRPLARFANTSLLTEKAMWQYAKGKGGPFAVAVTTTLGKRGVRSYHSTTWGMPGRPNEPLYAMTCYLNPVGFGNLTISEGSDPLAHPIVQTNLLDLDQDFDAALQCTEDFRKIIRGCFPEDFQMVEDGPSHNISTEDWVKTKSLTPWHFVGGSAVGSVVDGNFQLIGSPGLRVVDASVLPKLPPSAGVLSSVYIIAEHASDKLFKKYSEVLGPKDIFEAVPWWLAFFLLGFAVLFTAWVAITALFADNKITAPSNGDTRHSFRSRFRLTVLFSWSEVSCHYRDHRSSNSVVTLKNAFGSMRATELTAVMGGSGSSKSTLLDILSGRKTLGSVTGKISLTGKLLKNIQQQLLSEDGALRSIAAYVPQQEAFFPMQTATEAVEFTANLKLGRDPAGLKSRMLFVKSLLRDVGLSAETCQRPIGGELAGGVVIRGLSGGERKRLAVACALALKPRLLFLDEITSGLDSENALAITKLIKHECTTKNVAAMMVVHQPDAELFGQFDRLVLLARGVTLFSNESSKLPDFYRDTLHAPMPKWHLIPSDLVHQIGCLSDDVLQTKCTGTSNIVPTTSGAVDGDGQRTPPGAFWKFQTVFERNLMNHYVRNLANLASRLLLYAVTALINGLIFWQVADSRASTDAGMQLGKVTGALTFLILSSYLLPFAMMPIFVKDKKFFLAESALGLYSPWLYCISQLILETWVITLAAVVESCIVIPMCGLWNPTMADRDSFLTFLGVLITSGLVGSTIVMFHAIVLPSQDLSFLAGSGVVTIGLALSGGYVPFPEMRGLVSWLQWFSPCKYSLQALSLTLFTGTPYLSVVQEIYAFNEPPTVSGNTFVLALIFVGLAVGAIVALSRQREMR